MDDQQQRPLLRAGDRLPSLALRPMRDGGETRLQPPFRGEPVLLLLPAPAPPGLERYLEEFADALDRFRLWNGQPLVVATDGGVSAAESLPLDGPPVYVDPGGACRRRLGVEEDAAAVIIADRWGQVYLSAASVDVGELPGVSEVEEWLKFLATQCPECGVPDEPGLGEWTLS